MKRILIVLIFLFVFRPAGAQEQSVRPGINKQFENPNVEEFVGRFERDGRDPYDHRQDVVKAIGLKPGMVVADIGAGTGLFTRLFAPLVEPGGKVIAVDIAENFVRHIELRARELGIRNIEGVVCTAESVNLPPQSIDLAYICDVYHHFEYPHKMMRSIHRALKPGGAVVLIDFQRIEGVSSEFVLRHVRAGQEIFAQEIINAGFRQVEERKGLLKESYFLRFEKVND
jgi:predicted methyltransferase